MHFDGVNCFAEYIEIPDPFLFWIGGKMKHLVLRNINIDEFDNRHIRKFGYPFYNNHERDESDGIRREFSSVKSIIIYGLHVEEKRANKLNHPIINITNPLEELVIRDCEVIRHKAPDRGGCFIEIEKEAENLTINNVNLRNVEKDIDIKNGNIVNSNISNINK